MKLFELHKNVNDIPPIDKEDVSKCLEAVYAVRVTMYEEVKWGIFPHAGRPFKNASNAVSNSHKT